MNTSDKWNKRFINLAKEISTWSKDPSTRVGCVIVNYDKAVLSTGFNGFPRGVADDERLDNREEKYPIICHAEENAVVQAARLGVSLKDASAYIHPLPPCSRCSRLLIQAGISMVFFPDGEIPERWMDDITRSRNLLREAGISFRSVSP